LCGSRKYPYPHHGGYWKFQGGGGVLKAKIYKGMYEPRLEFPEGWAFKPKIASGGGMDIFWNNTFPLTHNGEVSW